MPVARLVGVSAELSFPLDKPIVLIGRHPDCDAVIQDSGKVSRRHCCVAHADDRFVIRDLGSMNGIRVNGVAVPFADLNPGDEVSVGDVQFLFERGVPAARAKRTANAAPDAPGSNPTAASRSAVSPSAKVVREPSSQPVAGVPELKETPPRELPLGSSPGLLHPAGEVAVQATPQLGKRDKLVSDLSTIQSPLETVNDPIGVNERAVPQVPQSYVRPEDQTLNIAAADSDESVAAAPSTEHPVVVFADAAAAFDQDVREAQPAELDLDDPAGLLADVSMEMPVAIDEDSSQGFDVMEVIMDNDDAILMPGNPPRSSDHSPPSTPADAPPALKLPPIPKRP